MAQSNIYVEVFLQKWLKAFGRNYFRTKGSL